MRTRPAPLSARKTSPFGAVRSTRGMSRPEASNSTRNPAGTRGSADPERATTDGLSEADRVARGGGRSSGEIRRAIPGASVLQSP